MKYLIDSTILIDHLNGVSPATEWLSKLDDKEAVISVITRAEVLVKASEKWEEVSALLSEYDCLPIGPDETDIAAGLRNRHAIKLPDAFQAALAKNEEIIFVTRDKTLKKSLISKSKSPITCNNGTVHLTP